MEIIILKTVLYVFKSMILEHIRPFLKLLFPFDDYDPEETLTQQNTPLGNIIDYNYEHNLSDIMDNIYERLIRKHDMNKLINHFNIQYHNLQRSIFKSVLEPIINKDKRPNPNDKDIQKLNIPPDILKELFIDLIKQWEAKHQQQPQPVPKTKPKPTLQPKPKPTRQPASKPKPKPTLQPKTKPTQPQPQP